MNLFGNDIKTALTYQSPTEWDLGGFDKQFSNAKGFLTGTRAYLLDDSGEFLTTAFYYDNKGQTVQQRATNHLQGFDIVYNKHNFTGGIEQTLKEHNTANNTVSELFTNTYDHAQRLTETKYSLNGATAITIAQNSYDDLGRLIEKKRHGGIDIEKFDYNIKSWLTKKQSGDFEQNLSYTGLYNGNISSMAIKNDNGNAHSYFFTYDALNRLKSGSGNPAITTILPLKPVNNETFTYDKHGNITHLTRYSGSTKMDDLTMSYDGNQLQSVTDAAYYQDINSIKEYNPKGDGTFSYDDNGNLTKDSDRGILSIEYNVLNLPFKIMFEGNNHIINVYAADGRKLSSYYVSQVTQSVAPEIMPLVSRVAVAERAIVPATRAAAIAVPIETEPEITAIATAAPVALQPQRAVVLAYTEEAHGTHYIGNIEYLFDKENDVETITKTRIKNKEGYFSNNEYFYYRKDQLGNNREVWNASTNTTVQRNNYYPSGLPWKYETDNLEQPYLYNDKEFVEDFGYNTYDYGFRGYYPAIGRFTSIDPLATMYYSWSPYCYTLGNPIRYIDIKGKYVAGTDGNPVTYENGQLSSNAPADVQRVGNAMLGTATGTERLIYMLKHDEKMSITISPDVVQKENGNYTLGKHLPKNPVLMSDGTVTVEEHQITIYEGSIKEVQEKTASSDPYKNMSLEDAIGAVAGHETGHTEQENLQQRLENQLKGTTHDVEQRPNEIEDKIIEEVENR